EIHPPADISSTGHICIARGAPSSARDLIETLRKTRHPSELFDIFRPRNSNGVQAKFLPAEPIFQKQEPKNPEESLQPGTQCVLRMLGKFQYFTPVFPCRFARTTNHPIHARIAHKVIFQNKQLFKISIIWKIRYAFVLPYYEKIEKI
ncbi:unnamed protein product, partial [Nesidiocoris tenuis]